MKNKFKALLEKPLVLLAAAAVLLVISTVGSTQAAMTYYSDNYISEVPVPNTGVDLLENGESAYSLLEGVDQIVPGETYQEELTAENLGSSDGYVRIIIKKYWTDAEGKKDRTLSPEYIELLLAENPDWLIDPNATTAERMVFYYRKPLAPGEVTTMLTRSIRIDNAFETTVSVSEETDGNFKNITYTHPFDNYQLNLFAEADIIQKQRAKDAIKSEWGINVEIDENGLLSFADEEPITDEDIPFEKS